MTRLTTEQWLLFAGFLAAIATIISGLDNWHQAIKPAVIGGLLAQLAIQLRSLFTNPNPSNPGSTVSTKGLSIVVLACLLGGSIVVSSCGDNPRVQLLHGSQSITAAVQGFQQAENALCGVDAAKPTHCDQTYAGVTSAQLDTAHQAIEKAIGKFAADKIVFDKAAAAWQPGQGAPASLSALTADADLIITTLQGLPAAAPISSALSTAQNVLGLITQLIAQFTGK